MKPRKLLSNLSILIVSLALTACISQKKLVLPPIPANLLIKCDEYKPLSNNTMGALLDRYIENLELGAKCAAKVDAFINLFQQEEHNDAN